MKEERPTVRTRGGGREEARAAVVDKSDPLLPTGSGLHILKKSECCNFNPALITLHYYTVHPRPRLSSRNSQKILNLHSCASDTRHHTLSIGFWQTAYMGLKTSLESGNNKGHTTTVSQLLGHLLEVRLHVPGLNQCLI